MKDSTIKKVGTLTFHIAHNYGAMLQAYALPIVVQKLGFECEVIDYRFPYIDAWSRIERWNDLVGKYGVFWGGLRFINRVMHGYYSPSNMHIHFDAFEREVIPHSQKVYRSKSELYHMPYDAILFGSDQIWNSEITNGIAEEYIGGFECLPGTRKIAYAASCGTDDFQEESKAVYENHLKSFYAISVREENFGKALRSRGYHAEWVLDPTLLLTGDEWRELIPKGAESDSGRYLLLYVFDEDEKLYDLVREYAKEQGLEIIVVAYKKKDEMYGMTVRTDCGPLEFLALFSNAEQVITTSFHGTAFSILFHKNFHCIPHPKYRERTDSLLGMLDLKDHNVNELTSFHEIETDWNRVDSLLENKRAISRSFLMRALATD